MAWLTDGSDCESIIEESLPMPNINSVLTLLKISEENCEVDEDEFYLKMAQEEDTNGKL